MAAAHDRQSMDELADKIRRHYAMHPDDFAGREPLWVARENLRRKMGGR